jgi:hypothetical protein
MKFSTNYCITVNQGQTYLANIVNGDLFLINDVVESILLLCEELNTVEELTKAIFTMYEDKDEGYTIESLKEFIQGLIDQKIIEV